MAIRKLLAAGIVLASLVGCVTKTIEKRAIIDGYEVIAIDYGELRTIYIKDFKTPKENIPTAFIPRIFAEDYDNDGRFDRMTFATLPKGHPLEKYVSLEKLEKVYQKVMGEGE